MLKGNRDFHVNWGILLDWNIKYEHSILVFAGPSHMHLQFKWTTF